MAFLEPLPLPNKRHYSKTLFLAVTLRPLLFSDGRMWVLMNPLVSSEQRMSDITGLSLAAVPLLVLTNKPSASVHFQLRCQEKHMSGHLFLFLLLVFIVFGDYNNINFHALFIPLSTSNLTVPASPCVSLVNVKGALCPSSNP